jgi:hypothetical protein
MLQHEVSAMIPSHPESRRQFANSIRLLGRGQAAKMRMSIPGMSSSRAAIADRLVSGRFGRGVVSVMGSRLSRCRRWCSRISCRMAVEGIQAHLIKVSQGKKEMLMVARRGRLWTLHDYIVVEIDHDEKVGRDGKNVVRFTMKSEGVRPTLRLNSLRHASNVRHFVDLVFA